MGCKRHIGAWLVGAGSLAAAGVLLFGRTESYSIADPTAHGSTVASSAVQPANTSQSVTNTYTLRLAGDTHDTTTVTLSAVHQYGHPPAESIADAHPQITLPLYPGATPTSSSFLAWSSGTPLTPYSLSGTVSYRLPAVPAQARTWFSKELQRAGLVKSGSGSTGNVKTGVFAEGDTYDKTGSRPVRVSTSFLASGSGTLFTYTVSVIAVPPRPQDSFIPGNVTSIAVRYKPWGYGSPLQEEEHTFTRAAQIQQLTQVINQLPPSAGGVRHCALDTGQGALLTLTTAAGKSITIQDDPACWSVRLGHTALDETTHGLWDTLSALLGYTSHDTDLIMQAQASLDSVAHIFPLRQATLLRNIHAGGPGPGRTIPASLSTDIQTVGDQTTVTFTESWKARDFNGGGTVKDGMLTHVWKVVLRPHEAATTSSQGAFPPQDAK